MNIFIFVFLTLGGLILLLALLALIIDKNYAVEREIIINQSRPLVFDYIKRLKNQEEYSIWVSRDPTNQIVYHGVDGTVGFISKWEGQKQGGKGEQEIISLVDDGSIHTELRFEKPFASVGQAYLITTDVGEQQTKIKWKLTGRNEFPFTLMNLFIDGLLGKDMKKSLINVKHILEKN